MAVCARFPFSDKGSLDRPSEGLQSTAVKITGLYFGTLDECKRICEADCVTTFSFHFSDRGSLHMDGPGRHSRQSG